MPRRTLFLLAAGALAFAASFRPDPAAAAPDPNARVEVGREAPALELSRVRGAGSVELSELRGQVVVLDFWATWCSPCRAIMPILDRLHRDHSSRGLSVLGLSPEPAHVIESHLTRAPVGYTVARDLGATAARYRISVIPTLVVIDRAGRVREIQRGVDGPSLARLRDLVERLLDEPAP